MSKIKSVERDLFSILESMDNRVVNKLNDEKVDAGMEENSAPVEEKNVDLAADKKIKRLHFHTVSEAWPVPVMRGL